MKDVIYAAVRIEYESNLKCTKMDDDENSAIDLAINPNFNTILNGVSLKSVNILKTESFQPVNWNDLKYNPDEVYVKQ